MAENDRIRHDSIWVILLAGGEGLRLRGRTVGGIRFDRPKQFCRVHGEHTLLDLAMIRARALAEPSRILPAVRSEHRRWWEPPLSELPPGNVLSQPADLGNAVAIFHALFQILRRDLNPIVVVLPSDHGIEDEPSLLKSVRELAAEARRRCDRVVLLGMKPDHAEPDYGWIVPAAVALDGSHRVVQFVEKPSVPEAEQLMRRGALWNSFIFASTALGLLRLFNDARPDLIGAYPESLLARELDERAAANFFGRFPAMDFGRDVLARSARRLRVSRAAPCGWIDLGTPERVTAWLARQRRAVALVPYGLEAVCEMTRT